MLSQARAWERGEGVILFYYLSPSLRSSPLSRSMFGTSFGKERGSINFKVYIFFLFEIFFDSAIDITN